MAEAKNATAFGGHHGYALAEGLERNVMGDGNTGGGGEKSGGAKFGPTPPPR